MYESADRCSKSGVHHVEGKNTVFILHGDVLSSHRSLDRSKACDGMGSAELQKLVNSVSDALIHAVEL